MVLFLTSNYTIDPHDRRIVTTWTRRRNGQYQEAFVVHCTIRMGFRETTYWTQDRILKGRWESRYRERIHQAMTRQFRIHRNHQPIAHLDLGYGANNFIVYFNNRQSVEMLLDRETGKGQFAVANFGENNINVLVDTHSYEVKDRRTEEEQRNEAATNDRRLRLEDTPLVIILRHQNMCFDRPLGRRFFHWNDYHKGKLIVLCNYIYSFQPDPDSLIDKIFGWLNELAELGPQRFVDRPSRSEEQLINAVVRVDQFDAWLR